MAGPPTPPLTTDTEIQDAVRSSNTTEVAASVPPEPAQDGDPYTATFPLIAALAAKSDFQTLIKTAEQGDLSGVAGASRRATRLLVVAPLALSYLIVDDLPPAWHALNRLPDNLLLSPLGQSLQSLVAAAIERKHARVYLQAENLFNLARQPTFFDKDLASVLADLVFTFVDTFRSRTSNLLSRAYTSLPFSLAQVYLGLNTEEMLAAAEKNNWSYDATTGILSPTPPQVVAHTAPDLGSVSSLTTFHFIANSVAKLEL